MRGRQISEVFPHCACVPLAWSSVAGSGVYVCVYVFVCHGGGKHAGTHPLIADDLSKSKHISALPLEQCLSDTPRKRELIRAIIIRVCRVPPGEERSERMEEGKWMKTWEE